MQKGACRVKQNKFICNDELYFRTYRVSPSVKTAVRVTSPSENIKDHL